MMTIHKDDAILVCAVVVVGALMCAAVAVNEDNRRRWRARRRNRRNRRSRVFTSSLRKPLSRSDDDNVDNQEEVVVMTKRQRHDQLPVYSTMALRVKPLKPRCNKTSGRKRRLFEKPRMRTRVMLCKHKGTTLRFCRDFRGQWNRAADDNDLWWSLGSSEWDPAYKTWCDRSTPLYSDMDSFWQTKSLHWRQHLHGL